MTKAKRHAKDNTAGNGSRWSALWQSGRKENITIAAKGKTDQPFLCSVIWTRSVIWDEGLRKREKTWCVNIYEPSRHMDRHKPKLCGKPKIIAMRKDTDFGWIFWKLQERRNCIILTFLFRWFILRYGGNEPKKEFAVNLRNKINLLL